MKNIFLFIGRHFHFILFLSLQLICIYQIVNYSNYHKAKFDESLLGINGRINQKYSNAVNYFSLKKTNDSLQAANGRLYNLLKENYAIPDSAFTETINRLTTDSLSTSPTIKYHTAEVISNSVSFKNNLIVLNKGLSDGIKPGMGIITHQNAVVGIVTDATDRYSVAMSMLHKDSHISGKLLKTGETGTMSWEGQEPNKVVLNNIPQSVSVKKGDTVISSGFSTVLPKGKLIGMVESVKKDTEHNTLKIVCKTFANFHNLNYVLVIENNNTLGVQMILEKQKEKTGQ